MKILLIEDDKVDRASIKRDLRSLAFECEVVEAVDGTSAIKIAKNEKFDTVLLDYNLPDCDGLIVLKTLVSIFGNETPVIVLTGEESQEISELMVKEGAVDYVIKDECNTKVLDRVLRYAKWRKDFQNNAEYKFRQVFENSNDGIVILDTDGNIYDVNKASCQMWGYYRAEFLDLTIPQLHSVDTVDDGKRLLSGLATKQLKNAEVAGFTIETKFQRKDGSNFDGEVAVNGLVIEGKSLVLGVVRDITNRKEIESELLQANKKLKMLNVEFEQESHMDPLTNLLNRRGLEANLNRAVNYAKRSQQELFAILVDLDNFKGINDNFGHTSGDLVITEVARTLESSIRPYEYAARIGGDEFMILISVSNSEDAVSASERIRRSIKEKTFDSPSNDVKVTASFGISKVDFNIKTVDDLLAQSQHALHESKVMGKDTTFLTTISPKIVSKSTPYYGTFIIPMISFLTMLFKLNHQTDDFPSMDRILFASIWLLLPAIVLAAASYVIFKLSIRYSTGFLLQFMLFLMLSVCAIYAGNYVAEVTLF